ncbi:MAG: M28 family peptidase [Acidobacteriota bacterium]
MMKKARLALLLSLLLAPVLLLVWVQQPLVFPRASVLPAAVDGAALRQHVEVLSQDLVPRDHDHPENLDRAAAYIREHFEAAGSRVEEQPYQADGKTYRNVILRLGPTEGEAIVLGAHYDAYDVYPAADDNASGVAALLELARLLADQELQRPLHLVAYTLEEPPYFRTQNMGSAVHARSLGAAGAEVAFMISIEMIGYFSDQPGSQTYPSPLIARLYPTTGNFIAVVGRFRDGFLVRRIKASLGSASDLPVVSMNAPANLVRGLDFSDHLNYWHQGFPGLMVTDTSFYRNFAYHTEGDTADRLDYGRMAEVVAGLHQVVLDHQD